MVEVDGGRRRKMLKTPNSYPVMRKGL